MQLARPPVKVCLRGEARDDRHDAKTGPPAGAAIAWTEVRACGRHNLLCLGPDPNIGGVHSCIHDLICSRCLSGKVSFVHER